MINSLIENKHKQLVQYEAACKLSFSLAYALRIAELKAELRHLQFFLNLPEVQEQVNV